MSKKYTFALIGLALLIGTLVLITYLNIDAKTKLIAILSTQLCITVITVTYLTGQARIDFNAVAKATYGKEDSNG